MKESSTREVKKLLKSLRNTATITDYQYRRFMYQLENGDAERVLKKIKKKLGNS